MRIEKFIKYNVKKVNRIKEEVVLVVEYRVTFFNFIIPNEMLEIEDISCLAKYDDGTHDLLLILDKDKNFCGLETIKRIYLKTSPIDKFVKKEYEPLDYINYHNYQVFTQLDGITVVIGMSGAGKTHTALSMLRPYSNHFTKIAYLNYELTDRDISDRIEEVYSDSNIIKKIYDKLYIKEGIMTSLNLQDILQAMDVMPDDKVVFIIDNVGSVIGQEDNVYQLQNNFIKELDVVCKERGWHALALTQMVKDHNIKLFDESGEIKDSVTMSIMAGSIMLGNLARSVLFTAYNGETSEFKNKVLKRGTGRMWHELDRRDIIHEYRKGLQRISDTSK